MCLILFRAFDVIPVFISLNGRHSVRRIIEQSVTVDFSPVFSERDSGPSPQPNSLSTSSRITLPHSILSEVRRGWMDSSENPTSSDGSNQHERKENMSPQSVDLRESESEEKTDHKVALAVSISSSNALGFAKPIISDPMCSLIIVLPHIPVKDTDLSYFIPTCNSQHHEIIENDFDKYNYQYIHNSTENLSSLKATAYVRSPRNRRARARSFGWMVTRFAWMAAEFVSSKSETRYASDASCRAITADDWKRRSVCWNRLGLQTKQVSKLANSYFEILRNFTNKTLEGQLANEKFS